MEQRKLDTQIRQVRFIQPIVCTLHEIHPLFQLDRASKTAEGQVKSLASKGDTKNAKIIAKEIVRSRKQKDKLSVGKARMNSISLQLQEQLGE